VVVVGPLLHEHYNLLAWRVNSLAVYDPLDLQDLQWPLVDGVYTPHLETGMSITWTGLQPNYFLAGPVDHYAGWLAADELRPAMGAEIWRAVGEDTGVDVVGQTAYDHPAAVERYDRRNWHYQATVAWTGRRRYRLGGGEDPLPGGDESDPHRWEYTGSVALTSVSRGLLGNWLDNWNAAGDPYFSLAHRQHRWVSGDQLAAVAAGCGMAFRHAQFGVRFSFRTDAQVPDITTLVVRENLATVNTSWSDEGHGSNYVGHLPGGNSSSANVPNSDLAGLIYFGGQGVPDTAGDMLQKSLPSAYPAAHWSITSRARSEQPLIGLAIPEEVAGGSHPALRLYDRRTLAGVWTGQVGSLGSSIDDGRGLPDVSITMGPFSDPEMHTVRHPLLNFSVVAWGAGWETLRTLVPVEVEYVLTPGSGSTKFEGTFSDAQWGALYQVFFQGIEF
jgi:hypothetical protein